ncbi:hypothetical protein VTJ49DRAFT_4967 [Mycothermus thermophilus]|uniref:Cyanovirin-N domain-containing protein n=1 Tax=Humicola insolens TaxID=85995 RepID=A0ABR3VQN0_HUMIN
MPDFHASANDIHVDDGHILRAILTSADGHQVEASCDLDDYIGNTNGHFEWNGMDFSKSAQDITLAAEGDASLPVLRASLRNAKGELIPASINLAEHISNIDGALRFE